MKTLTKEEMIEKYNGLEIKNGSLIIKGRNNMETCTTKKIEYKVINGTSYHAETSQRVIDAIEHAKKYNYRIVLDYGDTVTGQSWGDIYDIRGYIGRSTGTSKIPLLLYNSRSIGGGAILDHCIIRIAISNSGRLLYQHATYTPKTI
jgi:hypothetical protein